MSKIIYILTVLFFAYVVDEVEGDRIVAFIKDVFKKDLSQWHKKYRNLRDKIFNPFG